MSDIGTAISDVITEQTSKIAKLEAENKKLHEGEAIVTKGYSAMVHKIAELEAERDKLRSQLTQCWACQGGSVEDGTYCSICAGCGWVTDEFVENQASKIAELEAENERLREDAKYLLSFAPKDLVPEGLDPTFYHTLTYEGDKKIENRVSKIRAALTTNGGDNE